MDASTNKSLRNNVERRSSRESSPQVLENCLSELQRLTLHQLEGFGWKLAFIRRPLFKAPIAVVVNCENQQYGLLEDDGSVNTQHNIQIRH